MKRFAKWLKYRYFLLSLIIGIAWSFFCFTLIDIQIERSYRFIFTFIGIIMVCISISFLIISRLAYHLREVPKRDSIFYGFIAFFLGCLIITFLPYPFDRTQLLPSKLHIQTPTTQKPCAVVQGIRGEDSSISYKTLSIYGWERHNNSLVQTEERNGLSWTGYSRNVMVKLTSQENKCSILLTWNGKTESIQFDQMDGLTVIKKYYQPPVLITILAAVFSVISIASIILFVIYLIVISAEKLFSDTTKKLKRVQVNTQNHHHWPWIVVAVLIGLSVFLFSSKTFGGLFWFDSISYLSAARSLADGQGYIMMNGDTYNWWPPLYPILLAPGYLIQNLSPFLYARLLNSALLVGSLLGFGIILSSLDSDQAGWKISLGVLVAALSPATLTTHIYFLSEPIFIFCIVWYFVFLLRFSKTHRTVDLILLALFSGMAAFSRYIGVTVVLSSVVFIFFLDFRREKWMVRGFLSALVGLFASIPTIFWIMHNYTLTGSLTGLRTASQTTFSANVHDAITALSSWLFPNSVTMALIAVILTILAFVIFIKKSSDYKRNFFLGCMGFYILIYIFYLLVSLTVVHNAPIDNRLLSPTYLPLLSIWFTCFLTQGKHQKAINLAGLLIGLSLLVSGVVNTIQVSKIPVVTKTTLLSAYSLSEDTVIRELYKYPLENDYPIYTNCPRCLCLHLGIYNATPLTNNESNQQDLGNLDQPFYLIWLTRVTNGDEILAEGSYSSPLPNLEKILPSPEQPEILFQSEDGGIYLYNPSQIGSKPPGGE